MNSRLRPDVGENDGARRNFATPSLDGSLAIPAITSEQLEAVVEDLDRRIHAGELNWQTARNAWSVVTRLFDDARSFPS